MEISNVVIRSRPMHKLFKKLSDFFKKRSESRQQLTYSFNNILYPTANCCIIRYEIINQRRKFELVMQGDFKNQYRLKSEDSNYVPEDFNFEEIIRNMRHKAHEINIG